MKLYDFLLSKSYSRQLKWPQKLLYANNKHTDQSAKSRSLVCAFVFMVIRFLKSNIANLAACKIAIETDM